MKYPVYGYSQLCEIQNSFHAVFKEDRLNWRSFYTNKLKTIMLKN